MILISEGHALVLFTSYGTLSEVLNRVRLKISETMDDNPEILAQGEDDEKSIIGTL